MIAELIPEAYDIEGKQTSSWAGDRKRRVRKTYPMGRYVGRPLAVHCRDFNEMRRFLLSCKQVSDKEQFGKVEYWQPPEEFEKTRKGDCDEYSLWTWRQLLQMGFNARWVGGTSGRYGEGHAWVTFEHEGRFYLCEPTYCVVGIRMPKLSTVRYEPWYSVEWDGEKFSYFKHEKLDWSPSPERLIPLAVEWLLFWVWIWLRVPYWIARKIMLSMIRP